MAHQVLPTHAPPSSDCPPALGCPSPTERPRALVTARPSGYHKLTSSFAPRSLLRWLWRRDCGVLLAILARPGRRRRLVYSARLCAPALGLPISQHQAAGRRRRCTFARAALTHDGEQRRVHPALLACRLLTELLHELRHEHLPCELRRVDPQGAKLCLVRLRERLQLSPVTSALRLLANDSAWSSSVTLLSLLRRASFSARLEISSSARSVRCSSLVRFLTSDAS